MLNWLKSRAPDAEPTVEQPAAFGAPAAASRFFEAFGEPRLKLSRKEVSAVLQWLVMLFMALALWRHAQPVPAQAYFVAANPKTGAMQISDQVATSFTPKDINKVAEIQHWIRLVWTGDAALTEHNLTRASNMVAGKAVAELADFIHDDAPVHRLTMDPLWTRAVDSVSTNLLSDNGTDVAIASVTLVESDKSGQRFKSVILLSMHYILIPPASIQVAERVNPIGLYITHFSRTIQQAPKVFQ